MNNIELTIKTNKPEISDNSLISYTKNLFRIMKRFKTDDVEILKDYEKVILKLESFTKSYLTKRNYLNSIIVYLLNSNHESLKQYQELRDSLNDKYKNEQSTKEKSVKQIKNWLSLDEINKIVDDLKEKIKINDDKDLEQNIQYLFMLIFWLNFPLRNDLQNTILIHKHYYDRLLNVEINKNNYLVHGNTFPFLSISQYKTVKKYGIKKIKFNNDVNQIYKIYSKINKSRYLLYNIKDNTAMTSGDITNSFNKLFSKYTDKKISTTMLRHIILSEKFGKIVNEMDEMSDIMGHSSQTQQQIYIKNN